jgi:predicted phosphate transport protein (TIGR00153 family)
MRTGWLSWVRANDKTIIDILESQGANLVTATSSLVELLTHFDSLMERGSRIKDLEHEGDNITHNLFAITSQTFVTPLDREDISRLTTGIDQIVNYVDESADKLIMFKIKEPTIYMVELAKVLLSASQEIYLLLKRLRKFKNANDLVGHCRTIRKYEHEGDTIYRNAIAGLFETNTNAVEIIKLKDVYENLEASIDRCQDTADIVEDIALKYG